MRVLFLPDNRSAEKVVECLLGWSRSGLLAPFAWRAAGDGGVPAEGSTVTRVEAGESKEMLLGAALQGADDGTSDELVAFYPATAEEGFEPGFPAAAIGYVDLLAQTIAHDAARPARCTMVVAPSQIGQPVPPQLLSQGFAANVYVAPEDRAEPRDPNRLLGNEEVFPMHAAHALATVADLWDEPASERPAVVDVLAKRQPHNQLAMQVVRCFSRGIDFGYLPDHVSAGIFYSDSGWPNPDQERLDRIDDPESVVPHVAGDYMRAFRQELGLSDFEPRRLEDPAPLGLFEAFMLLVRLIVARIRRRPFEIVRERIDSVYNKAADWVEKQAGPDSGIRVKRRGEGSEAGGEALDLELILEKPLVVPDGPVSAAWTALRRLVLGLVDGSDLPEGIDQVRLVNGRGQRALIADPAALAPNPEADPPPVADDEGPICDPLRFDPALAGRQSETPVSEALAEWAQLHSSSLLWKVGAKIGSDLLTAKMEAQGPPVPEKREDDEGEGEEADTPPASEQRLALRKRLRRSSLLSSAAAIFAAAVAAGQLSPIGLLVSFLAIGALWFYALANAARRWLLADEAISRREDEEKLAQLNAALKRSLRMGDEIRLQRRYREYLDWAEMLGWLLHKPWVGNPLDHVTLSPPIDHATLPAAFSVAVAEVSELGLERLSAAAGSGVFGVGWLSGLFERTERLEMTEIGIRRGLGTEEAEVSRPDPTTDVGKDREGPRQRLLDAVRRGKHRSLSGSRLGDEVLRYLGDQTPDRVCERVAILPTADGATAGEEIDALPPPLAGFEPPAVLAKIVEAVSPAVVRIESQARHRDFGGTGVLVGAGLVATVREVVEGASSIAVISAEGERFEAELKQLDPEANLALVSLEGGGELPSLALPEATEVAQGDPAISIGRPFEQEQPTVSWGLVTASEAIQVAYHRAEGSLGAPVFSLEGDLLGVHSATSVVPVAELRRLTKQGEGTADGLPQAPKGRTTGKPPSVIKPSDFIEELTHADRPPALLPHHWKDAEKKNEVKETIPSAREAATGTDDFSSLAGGFEFLAPLRVLVHRVDLVAPVAVRDLVSFPDMDDRDRGPDEMVTTEF